MRYGLSFLASALALTATQAAAGIIVTSTHTNLDTRQSAPAMIYAESDRLKVVLPNTVMIYRGDLNRMWAIDPQRGTYFEMTPESIQQMAAKLAGAQAQLGAAQAALQARLAQLPPAQRAMMEQMMASQGLGGGAGLAGLAGGTASPRQTSFAKVGGGKAIATWRCDLYNKIVDGQKEEEVCVVPLAAAGLSAADFGVLESIEKFIAPISSSPIVPRMAYMNWTDMNKAIGFQALPVDTTIYVNNAPSSQDTVKKVERAAIAADTFDLPPGLTKRTIGALP